MSNSEKIMRAAAIHDLSCFGRCALTVVIPVLSAMGIQCVPLPTALLSTHTGGFDNIFVESLTEQMKATYSHWQQLGIEFDAIYSGYLADEGQIEVVGDFIEKFRRKETLTLVDPVFADDGVYYSRTTDALVDSMKELCKLADVITPNITEACALCGIEYEIFENTKNDDRIKFVLDLTEKLYCDLGVKKIAITGIEAADKENRYICTIGTDKEKDNSTVVSLDKIGGGYPGTGDLFASVALSKMLCGKSFEDAISFASSFTRDTIEFSAKFGTPAREGVSLEPCIRKLIIEEDD